MSNRQRRLLLVVIGLVSAALSLLSGQIPLRFEAASIKRHPPGDNFVSYDFPGSGRFTSTNAPVEMLVEAAYKLRTFQIVGMPAWADRDGYDIVATPDVTSTTDISRDATLQRLKTLLVERFKLNARAERREMPIYALVVAKPGTFGPNLTRATSDCEAIRAERRSRPTATPAQPSEAACVIRLGNGTITAGGITLAQLAELFAPYVERTIVNRTDIAGFFNIKLSWTPERRSINSTSDPDGPSVFTAFQEQLGLKLEASRGPVDVLVIDNLQRPTDN